MEYQPSNNNLSHGQKTGFVLLLIFALIVVSLGFLQLRNTIYSPFIAHQDTRDVTSRALWSDENTRLQSIDTDHDGLNDYEELYFYNTSPYLPDTDSDKIDDKTEIEKGTDPLCAEGTNCAETVSSMSTSSMDLTSPLLGNVDSSSDILMRSQLSGQGSQSPSSSVDMSAILNDPAQLRQMLLATNNITAEQLEKIDDKTLMKMAQDYAQKELGVTAPVSTVASSTPSITTTTLSQ